jgi:hypothetical protein
MEVGRNLGARLGFSPAHYDGRYQVWDSLRAAYPVHRTLRRW